MPSHPPQETTTTGPERGAAEDGHAPRRRAGPNELTEWLEERVPRLQAVWSEEVRARGSVSAGEVEGLVERFLRRLVAMMPLLLGPQRDRIRPLWERACELFGSMGARRGLAAGEVIEEFHVLRELVIRELYRDPPVEPTARLSLREILRLNRILDRGVTYASVGHTDALFFDYLERDGEGAPPTGVEVAREIAAQLDGIVGEVVEVVGARWGSGDPPRPH